MLEIQENENKVEYYKAALNELVSDKWKANVLDFGFHLQLPIYDAIICLLEENEKLENKLAELPCNIGTKFVR